MTPSSLVTSYHYLRYILLGLFLYTADKYFNFCCFDRDPAIVNSLPVHLLVTALYVVLGATFIIADMRNYVLYKLLYYKYYEHDPKQAADLISNVDILKGLLEHRDIYDKLYEQFKQIKNLSDDIRKEPDGIDCLVLKMKLNKKMFFAVQPGPVSAFILLLYSLAILVPSITSFVVRYSS